MNSNNSTQQNQRPLNKFVAYLILIFIFCVIPIGVPVLLEPELLETFPERISELTRKKTEAERVAKTFYSKLRGDFRRTPDEMLDFFVDAQAFRDSEAALAIYNADRYCDTWQGERICTPGIYGPTPQVKLLESNADTAEVEVTGTIEPKYISAIEGNTIFIVEVFGEIPVHHRVILRKVDNQWRIASIETLP